MPPPTPEDLRALVQLLAVFLFGLALYLRAAPVGSCDRCAHCRAERADNAWCGQHGRRKRDCLEEHRP